MSDNRGTKRDDLGAGALGDLARKVDDEGRRVWRYATAAGEKASRPEGWVLEP